MPAAVEPTARTSADTKARIVTVAQDIFATKGYSHAGLREIASLSGVAPSLLIKHFGSKAKLFEEALASAMLPLRDFQNERERLGARPRFSISGLDGGHRI